MLYISAIDEARKLKFSSYVYLPPINKKIQYRYARVILCSVGEGIILEHRCYISALEHISMLILNSYVLLACINTILGDLVRCIGLLSFNFGLRSSIYEV